MPSRLELKSILMARQIPRDPGQSYNGAPFVSFAGVRDSGTLPNCGTGKWTSSISLGKDTEAGIQRNFVSWPVKSL